MGKPFAATTLLAGASAGIALSFVVAAVTGQPLDLVAVVVTAAAGMVAGWVVRIVWPERRMLDAEHSREARRKAFLKQKSRRDSWSTYVALLVLGAIGALIVVLVNGWQALKITWLAVLFAVGYAGLVAGGVSDFVAASLRKSRQTRVVAPLLHTPVSRWRHVTEWLKENRYYCVLTCCLFPAWTCVLGSLDGPSNFKVSFGRNPIAACLLIPTTMAWFAWILWSIVIYAKLLVKFQWQPSRRVLAMAVDPATKVRAIRLYRRRHQLALKEARRVIETCLALRADRAGQAPLPCLDDRFNE